MKNEIPSCSRPSCDRTITELLMPLTEIMYVTVLDYLLEVSGGIQGEAEGAAAPSPHSS